MLFPVAQQVSCGLQNLHEGHTPVKFRSVLTALILLAAAALPATPPAQKKPKTSAANNAGGFPAATQAQVERGRYIVEEVARCWECHTPRDENGQPERSRWLQGAPIWIMPVHPDSSWAMRAPDIAGFPSFTEEQGEKILEQGIGPNGLPIHPPMHTYHLTHDDAIAVIAYLRTVPRSPSPQ
jgi:mono/diheme cytochrome c family protein